YRHDRCCGAIHSCYGYPACCPNVVAGHEAGFGAPANIQTTPEVQARSNGANEKPASAILIVNLPAQATLTIDDSPTQSTSGIRQFTSPPLEPESDFYYTLQAHLIRNGQSLTESRRVRVRAGEQTEVTLEFSTGTMSAKLTQ